MFEYFKTLKRLSKLEEEYEDLNRQWKKMQLEWEDTYDKLRTVVMRVAKRAQRVDAAQPEGASQTLEEPAPEAGSLYPNLTPAQAVAQARILARRARMRQ